MTRRPLLVLLLALGAALGAAPARAQLIPRRVATAPAAWASLSLGYVQFDRPIDDGATGSRWDFGGAAQWRASLEHALRNDAGVGVSASLARVPLRYTPASGFAMNAHATVWSAEGFLHIGGGPGFHQVIELSAGATVYDDFRADATGERLPPSRDPDLDLGVAYGFGYSLNERAALTLVQGYEAAFHQRTGYQGNQGGMTQRYVTRLGLRVGLGTRRAPL